MDKKLDIDTAGYLIEIFLLNPNRPGEFYEAANHIDC